MCLILNLYFIYDYPLLISTVTDTPTNLTAMRTGLYQGNVSWSPPVSNYPVVLGYELFYDLPNGTRESIEVISTLMITFSDLDPESSYPGFVVAYGGDLPSSRSNNGTLQEGKKNGSNVLNCVIPSHFINQSINLIQIYNNNES